MQTVTLSGGDNKLVYGTARKTWSSNIPLIAKFVFAELLQNMSPAMALLPGILNTLGEGAFVTTITGYINILLVARGKTPVSESVVSTIINALGGAQKMADMIEAGTTLGLNPNSGYLYVFQDTDLNIPAGEYTIGAVWRSGGQEYIFDPKNEWIDSIDWLAGVPNLSWLGEWVSYNYVTGLREIYEDSSQGEIISTFDLGLLPGLNPDIPIIVVGQEEKKPNFLPIIALLLLYGTMLGEE